MASWTGTGPGKTSPRISADFLAFDPLKVQNNLFQVLTDHASVLGEANYATTHPDACNHAYAVKATQSQPPPLDLRPDNTTVHKLAVVCKNCRIHAQIIVDYQHGTNPCPNAQYPLHHFQRLTAYDVSESTQLRYGWQCSASDCKAVLTIGYNAQIVSSSDILALTDTSRLRERWEDVKKNDPEREGMMQCTPVDAVSRLRRYIKDALSPERTRRTFPANNKRFMEAFGYYGHECQPMLEKFGFQYIQEEGIWALPLSEQDSTGTWTYISARNETYQQNRDYIENIEVELLSLLYKVARDNGLPNPAVAEEWLSANRDIDRVLGAQGYLRVASPKRPTAEYQAYAASLGALTDFGDSLIDFCYERQSLCDPGQQSYYFECLKEIASFRSSENLMTKATILETQGMITRSDLREAYGFFGANTDSDDDRILNLYQAQLPDLSSEAAEKSRVMLLRIGTSRDSKLLINAAQQSIETVDEALTWLGNGVDKNTNDEMLLTVFTIRTDGDPAKEELGRKAISVIAKDRQSAQLNTWLETGRTDGYTMSIDEALRHLDITTSIDGIDETIWPAIFEEARSSRPGTQTDKAIAAIQHVLAGVQPEHRPEDWPVGLTSLGNTCYLNSLLQYYFSIKPLRDIVLDYDQFKFDLSTASEKEERVGQRQISLVEIKGGQKFAEDLRHLFERMIKDRSSSVKPEQDLVCRAFLDPKDSDLWENKDRTVEHVIAEPEDNASAIVAEPEDIATEVIQIDDSQDTKMQDPPLTPPASPGVKPVEATKPPPLPPRRFSTTTNAALERAQSNATQQQDVTEVHDGIQFRLRAGLKSKGHDASGEQLDDLLQLFSISLLDTPVKDGTQLKSQLLRDSAIQLDVPTEQTDIYSALDAVFDLQPVEGNESLERYKSISTLPPFLQINIPRVGFDKVKGEQFKSEHCIKLVDELYLDRYCANDASDILDRRRSAWGWRRKLAELKKRHEVPGERRSGLDGPTAVAECSKYLKRIGEINNILAELGVDAIECDTELSDMLSMSANQQAIQLRQVDVESQALKAQLAGLFEGMQAFKYRLAAVFFHRGKTAHGHYWICIRDFSENTWRRYNDERVERVSDSQLNEIFEANDWSHGTPTYAVYVQDEQKLEMVQPVCRQPEPLPEPVVQETPTGDPIDAAIAEGRLDSSFAQADKPADFVIEGDDASWDKARAVGTEAW